MVAHHAAKHGFNIIVENVLRGLRLIKFSGNASPMAYFWIITSTAELRNNQKTFLTLFIPTSSVQISTLTNNLHMHRIHNESDEMYIVLLTLPYLTLHSVHMFESATNLTNNSWQLNGVPGGGKYLPPQIPKYELLCQI